MPRDTNPRRVMVATDRSETAERAVVWAAQFADRFGADLHVVQVLVAPDPDQVAAIASERVPSETETLVEHARALAGIRGHGRVVVAEDPAAAIVRASEEDDIDVLVVGNAGMAGRKEFLLGNVPNRISHNARCTVIIVNTLGGNGKVPASAFQIPDAPAAQPHRVARGGTIATVFAKHGIRELFGGHDDDGGTGRRRQARSLRAALEELGPTFAKLGQILSTRPDLLPPEFIEELAQLRDSVTPMTEEQVVRVMEQDLGVPWEDVFETIQREPLAAGSIAQVHRASLASGEKVVIKVQRPEAHDLITQDLALLKVFVERIGTRPGVRRLIDVAGVFEHLSTSLQHELDFRREAKNADRLRGAVSGFSRLAIPSIYSNISTMRLLVMQDVAGVSSAGIPEGPLRKEIAKQLIESFCTQILIEGFFHGDPHPGNVMWQPAEQRLYFLDLGLVGEVSSDMRELMILMLIAFWQKDAGFLADVILMLSGTDRGELNIEAFRTDIEALVAKHHGASIASVSLGPVLQEIIAVSFRNGVPLPASLTLTAKSLAQMQIVTSQLDPDSDPFDIAGRFLMHWLLRRTVSKSDPKVLFYEAQKLRVRVMRLFEALELLVGARPGHKTDFSFRAATLEETLRRASRRLALGITGGFAVLASALTAISDRGNGWMTTAFAVASAMLILALVVDMVRGDQPAAPAKPANPRRMAWPR